MNHIVQPGPNLFLLGPSCRVCAKNCQYSKGRYLSTYFQANWKQDLQAETSKVWNYILSIYIYIVPWDDNCKICWPPDQKIWRYPLGDNYKNRSSGWVYKLLSGGYQWAVVRPWGRRGEGHTNKVSLCLHSLRVASAASRPVVNLKSILRFKLQNN